MQPIPNQCTEFEHPPLDEMVIGIQFHPLVRFRAAHFGMYWQKIRERYPGLEDQPAIPPQTEPAESLKPQLPHISFGMPGAGFQRCWFLSANKTQLIQVQRDHFLRNWRKVDGKETYPRFPRLIQDFKDEWAHFKSFVSTENLGNVAVNQCELTYFNRIEKGDGWEGMKDVSSIFTAINRPPNPGLLCDPEIVAFNSKYKLPDGLGRLHVSIGPTFRARDMKIVLSLELTARGMPKTASDEAIFSWYDLAHEWIVNGFCELTNPDMHERWGKK